MMRRLVILVLAFALPLLAEGVLEPADYQGEPYHAPVPDSLEGAVTIDNDTAYALWYSQAVAFIDVLPQAPKPENLPEGTLYIEPRHDSIDGAIWLPDVGYQQLSEGVDSYFRAGLGFASGGDFDAPIVIFCRDDCWQSWNAAKRALEYGYSRIYWYPEGTDGWANLFGPTQKLQRFVVE